MSDTNDDDSRSTGRVTHSRMAGVSAGAFPYSQMAGLFGRMMTSTWEMQRAALDLMRGQTLVNLQAMGRAFNMKQSTGTQLYRNLLDNTSPQMFLALRNFIDAFPEPQRSIMRSGMMSENDFIHLSHDPQVLAAAERFFDMLPHTGELSKPAYNHKILAERKDGSVDAVDPERIIALFQPTPMNGMVKPSAYPRIIFTSSHASGESLADVTHITHGIEALARDSFGHQLNVTTIDQSPKKGETMILYACDSKKNPPLNGIDLTRRLNEIADANRTGQPDTFEHASPGAKRIAKIMLACMCENFYDENGHAAFDVNGQGSLSEVMKDSDYKLRLSSDARRVAQHFQLMGYSKGGNVVSDAIRYLEHELRAVDEHGRGIVRTPKEWPVDRGILREEKYGVRSIMNNISTASIAAREHPFTDAQKQNGLRRVAFNNAHDPLTSRYHYDSSYNDEFYVTDGNQEDGHDPELALGTREDRGYFLDDADVDRRMKEFFAAHYGRAAVANLFVEDGQVKIEAAPSTPDSMLADYAETITQAMEQAGLHHVKLVGNDYHIGTFELHADEDLTRDADAIRKLGEGFNALRASTPGLIIAQKINDTDIDSLLDKARRRPNNAVREGSVEGRTKGPGPDGRTT